MAVRTGITPACAGKRRRSSGPRGSPRNHPRVCGEKPFLFYGGSSDSGSPPRMRGKAVPAALPDISHRITPAYAGKSEKQVPFLPSYQDHPRVCGEKTQPRPRRMTPTGSPPRMRGKETSGTRLLQRFRITPAYAGKRRRSTGRAAGRGDHPRVCGEKMYDYGNNTAQFGSPPRVRGKDGPVNLRVCHAGITPACAGKSLGPASLMLCHRDHPRVCGEKCYFSLETDPATGSPPRVRGKD